MGSSLQTSISPGSGIAGAEAQFFCKAHVARLNPCPSVCLGLISLELEELGVFSPCLLKDGNIGVSIVPEFKEVLVGCFRLLGIS
jgi:hypothetical protein